MFHYLLEVAECAGVVLFFAYVAIKMAKHKEIEDPSPKF